MLVFYIILLGALTELSAQATSSVIPFRLYTAYDVAPPDRVQQAMHEEVESIMEPIGWQIDWAPMESATGSEMSVALAVVHFTGVCDVAALALHSSIPKVLGMTHVVDGKILPFSDVDCNAIRDFLIPALTGMNAQMRQRVFGRAVGRVLAHELYHALTKEQGHGSKGIGEAYFTPLELSGSKFRFAVQEVQKLRMNLLPVLTSFEHLAASELKAVSVFVTSGCSGCHGPRGEGTRWGPSLQLADRNYDAASLQVRLTDTASAMYTSAKSLNVLWPRLNPADVELLSGFLKTLANQAAHLGSEPGRDVVPQN